ncbi:radical SAM protein, partial [archaeon]|nr:radical SAM protein [archaeon]
MKLKNIFKAEKKEKIISIKPPKQIEISLHKFCNFKCKMCQIWKNKEFEKMPLENVYKIIDEATKFGSKNMTIQFLGGETLLYKDLDKAIWYATKKGFRTVITTNAYLLSHKRLTQLSNAGLSNINIS